MSDRYGRGVSGLQAGEMRRVPCQMAPSAPVSVPATTPAGARSGCKALALHCGAWEYLGISALSLCAPPHLSGHGDRLVLSSKQDMVSPSHPEPFPCHLSPVALNFQTAGTEMDLCDGLFSQNGRCGYVLKPPFMRDEETLFNPGDPSSREGPGPITLTIQVRGRGATPGSCDSVLGLCRSQMGGDTAGHCSGAKQCSSRSVWWLPGSRGPCPFPQVISGQQLPKVANSKDGAIIDPLVRVEIYGVPADQTHQETKYIENNGEPRGGTRDPTVPRWPQPCPPSPSQHPLSLPRVQPPLG